MIRPAEERDVSSLMAIYNYEVLNGLATFDTRVKTYDERLSWFNAHSGKYRLSVYEEGGAVLGYASLSPYNERGAFSHTAEISVYVERNSRGKGIGKALMAEILSEAERDGEFSVVISQITAGNTVSRNLHAALGFKYAGTLDGVGFKFGKRLSLEIYEYFIRQTS